MRVVLESFTGPVFAGMDQPPCLVNLERSANIVGNLDQDVGRIGRKPVARNRLLHRVECFEHDAGDAELDFLFLFFFLGFDAELVMDRAEKLVDRFPVAVDGTLIRFRGVRAERLVYVPAREADGNRELRAIKIRRCAGQGISRPPSTSVLPSISFGVMRPGIAIDARIASNRSPLLSQTSL